MEIISQYLRLLPFDELGIIEITIFNPSNHLDFQRH
jgi:hypothetical protein